MVFIFNDNLFQKFHTNLIKNDEIDKRDMEYLDNKMITLRELIIDIIKYFD